MKKIIPGECWQKSVEAGCARVWPTHQREAELISVSKEKEHICSRNDKEQRRLGPDRTVLRDQVPDRQRGHRITLAENGNVSWGRLMVSDRVVCDISPLFLLSTKYSDIYPSPANAPGWIFVLEMQEKCWVKPELPLKDSHIRVTYICSQSILYGTINIYISK